MALIADPVRALLGGEAARPVPPAVRAVAEAARTRFGPAVRAVLFYGSCLRDGEVLGRLVDLYLLTDGSELSGRSAPGRWLAARLPPDVHRVETSFEGRTVQAKVAVVPLAQLERLVAPTTREPYFWARLAQPVAIVWTADAATRARVEGVLAQAARTLAGAVRPLLGPAPAPRELFERAFAETYRTELRAEPPGRAAELVAAAAERYERLGALLLGELEPPDPAAAARAARLWAWRRRIGKLRSILRLARAASTFEAGADYLVWKIERHSGERITLRPWQRRHPILAGLLLLPRLRRRGAVR